MNEIPSEHAEQVALVKKLKSENIFVASIPNGVNMGYNKQKYIEMNYLKSEGLLPGFPDLFIQLPNHTILIEMKNKTGKLSDKQKDVQNILLNLGLDVRTFYSAKEAWQYIDGIRKEL